MGRHSDREIARRLDRPLHAVQYRRYRLGIAPGELMVRAWTAEEDSLLGTMPDKELARKLNRTVNAVELRRNRQGIPPLRARSASTDECQQ